MTTGLELKNYAHLKLTGGASDEHGPVSSIALKMVLDLSYRH